MVCYSWSADLSVVWLRGLAGPCRRRFGQARASWLVHRVRRSGHSMQGQANAFRRNLFRWLAQVPGKLLAGIRRAAGKVNVPSGNSPLRQRGFNRPHIHGTIHTLRAVESQSLRLTQRCRSWIDPVWHVPWHSGLPQLRRPFLGYLARRHTIWAKQICT